MESTTCSLFQKSFILNYMYLIEVQYMYYNNLHGYQYTVKTEVLQ
jgi:hypothetical protein